MLQFIVFEITILGLLSPFSAASPHSSDHQEGIHRLLGAFDVNSHNKCGFHIIANYYESPGDRFGVKNTLQYRPANDTSVLSPSGKFRIHFDTTDVDGNQAFLYDSAGQEIPNSTYSFVDSVAQICDYVYHVEVDSLGYPPPPSDGGAGGGNEYDVYIVSGKILGDGVYGYTDFDPDKPLVNRVNPTYAAWTVIRNEFQSTYTHGIPAIEVTIAHEFHHGIQVGNYGLWQGDVWFYELTSTWMEQVVYPGVKDYYQYLSQFFNYVDLPFNLYRPSDFAGYERCVFGVFVQNQFGASVMKTIWQNMAHEGTIPAIEDAFVKAGKSPSSAFDLFAQANYFTNYRTALASQFDVVPYPCGSDYPLVKISSSADITNSSEVIGFSDAAMRLTEHFYQIYDGSDTLGLAVVNDDFSAAIKRDTTGFPFSTGISTGGSNCVRQLANGYCLYLSTPDYANWGFVPLMVSDVFAEKSGPIFPQPFNPAQQQLKIPYSLSDGSSVSLSILSTSGVLLRRISSAEGTVSFLGRNYLEWDGKDEAGKMVSSGIYLYVLTNGSKTTLGKIAVVRN